MTIGILGGTGNAGRALVTEAIARGHETTAIVRDIGKAAEILGEEVPTLKRDAFALTSQDLAAFDVVVNAFGTGPDTAHQHVELAKHLTEAARSTGSVRLVHILGAGSLTTGPDHHLFVEDLRATPGAAAWIAIPENQLKELEYLRTVSDIDWVGVSPSALFAPGEATTPVLGGDELLVASDGESHTTTGTMAVAVLDEIERPTHRQTRFTVSDA